MSQNLERHGIERVHGEASLAPDGGVVVRDPEGGRQTLRARAVLLATGSRPWHPPEIPFADPDVHDSETLLIERLPERILLGAHILGEEGRRVQVRGLRRAAAPRGAGRLPSAAGTPL